MVIKFSRSIKIKMQIVYLTILMRHNTINISSLVFQQPIIKMFNLVFPLHVVVILKEILYLFIARMVELRGQMVVHALVQTVGISIKTSIVNLLASNKSSVTVRLIAENGATDQWRVNEVTITGEYATVFAEEYTLTTSVSPATAGKITRSPNLAAYEENTVVSLTATPNIGYAFVEWQDGLGNTLSTANPYDVTMTENKTIVAVYRIAPIAAETEITAASWTFDTGYDIFGNIYTPNESEWEEFSQVQSKNNNAKVFNANTAYGALTAYEAKVSNDDTGKTYYSIKNNNGDKIFSLYPSGISNSITDYTNSAEHKVYFQFSFPTAGLKDISVTVEFTYGSNAVRNLELVYSTDGGTTWVDGGACAGGVNWYTYATVKKDLSADNKSNVIVRLLPANGEDGDYRMNSFRVSGTIDTTPVSISEAKYATYYNSIPVQLPANLQAATIDNEAGGTLTLNYRYGEGDVIPGGTPVLLKASAADTYNLTYVANDVTAAPTGNLLHGSDVATTTTGGEKYYALQYGKGSNASKLGFYWVNADGAAFTSGAHKAWLALPASTLARFFSMDDETTGVQQIESAKMNVEGYYNLAGQRVAQPQKGLYIVNGKKVVIK